MGKMIKQEVVDTSAIYKEIDTKVSEVKKTPLEIGQDSIKMQLDNAVKLNENMNKSLSKVEDERDNYKQLFDELTANTASMSKNYNSIQNEVNSLKEEVVQLKKQVEDAKNKIIEVDTVKDVVGNYARVDGKIYSVHTITIAKFAQDQWNKRFCDEDNTVLFINRKG